MRFHPIKWDIQLNLERIYVKEYEFLSFAKNMGKNVSNKYGLKLLDSSKNLQRMKQKLLQKKQFKKEQKQMVI